MRVRYLGGFYVFTTWISNRNGRIVDDVVRQGRAIVHSTEGRASAGCPLRHGLSPLLGRAGRPRQSETIPRCQAPGLRGSTTDVARVLEQLAPGLLRPC